MLEDAKTCGNMESYLTDIPRVQSSSVWLRRIGKKKKEKKRKREGESERERKTGSLHSNGMRNTRSGNSSGSSSGSSSRSSSTSSYTRAHVLRRDEHISALKLHDDMTVIK
ncbi:hypothetical protein MKS88_004664 [Plasmodium brasilianum]|uniref:Uncharacterized protein n=1 Tax=Plasmodium brasilianum TaxID=5824 RepID=A0ACB9Y7F6_PLABR|nr:hypothetical protein MKS88_004664 [Plasmodium brasilianum]